MNKNKGMLLILGTALISGFAVFLGKFGVSVINPYIFTGLKNIIVALLAVSWLLMMKDWRVLKNLSKKQWFLLSMVGLVGGSIPFLLFFKGLSLTAPAQAAFIHKTMFIYVALLVAHFPQQLKPELKDCSNCYYPCRSKAGVCKNWILKKDNSIKKFDKINNLVVRSSEAGKIALRDE